MRLRSTVLRVGVITVMLGSFMMLVHRNPPLHYPQLPKVDPVVNASLDDADDVPAGSVDYPWQLAGGCPPSTDKTDGGTCSNTCDETEFQASCNAACTFYGLFCWTRNPVSGCYVDVCPKDACGCAAGCAGHCGVQTTLYDGTVICN